MCNINQNGDGIFLLLSSLDFFQPCQHTCPQRMRPWARTFERSGGARKLRINVFGKIVPKNLKKPTGFILHPILTQKIFLR